MFVNEHWHRLINPKDLYTREKPKDGEGYVFKAWDIPTEHSDTCLLYTSPSPRDGLLSRMPSSA